MTTLMLARAALFLAVLAFGVAYFNDPFLIAWGPVLAAAWLVAVVLRFTLLALRLIDRAVVAAIRLALASR